MKLALAIIVIAMVAMVETTPNGARLPPPAAPASARSALPLAFEPNQGQFDSPVRFVAHGGGSTAVFTDTQATITVAGRSRIVLRVPSGRSVTPTASEPMAARTSYFVGSDPSRWVSNVPTFGRIVYPGVRDGIDLVFHGELGALEYDFVIHPGAALEDARLAIDGVDAVEVTERGELALHVADREFLETPPRAFQLAADGREQPVQARYAIDRSSIAFALGEYDRERDVVIDPVLVQSTYFGGSGSDSIYAVGADSTGIYFAGSTSSTDLPLANALQATNGGNTDAFVAKLNTSGTALLYSTYLGGSFGDYILSLSVGSNGSVVVCGSTASVNFPVTNAIQATKATLLSDSDAVIAQLTPSGTALTFSTYLGKASSDTCNAVAVDGSGSIYFAGTTFSSGLGTVGAFQQSLGGDSDGFAGRLAPGGTTLAYLTYLGAAGTDNANGVAVDGVGNAYVVGTTSSSAFPVVNALQPTFSGPVLDAFLVKLASNGASAIFSTFLGGSKFDYGYGVAVSQNDVVVVGASDSPNIATQGASQTVPGGNLDVFVTKISGNGATKLFTTLLGSTIADNGSAVAIDGSGTIFVTGWTTSSALPLKNPSQKTYGGTRDAFVARFSGDGARLLGSTYLGGTFYDEARAIALDPNGTPWVGGFTSGNFPLVAPFDSTPHQSFLAKIEFPLPITISPASVTLPPKATQAFTASAGAGAGYLFSLTTNASGGSVNPTTGLYVAGAMGNSADELTVTDPKNDVESITINVGPGVTVSPTTSSIAPGAGIAFSATGGSAQGFVWSMLTNGSGATVSATGQYVAGSIGSTTDVVQAVDSLGNVGKATVTVGPTPVVDAGGDAVVAADTGAGTGSDGAVDAGTPAPVSPRDDGGCACSTGSRADGESRLSWVSAVILGALVLRLRGRRPERSVGV